MPPDLRVHLGAELRHGASAVAAALVSLLLATTIGEPARAQSGDLAALFPQQAPIEAPVAGKLVRLDLPAEVLAACRADLSDLRVFDAEGREVPFLIDSGAPSDPAGRADGLEAVTVADAEILDATRETTERDGAPSIVRESYVIASPPSPPAGTAWDLVFAVSAADFASRVEVRPAPSPDAGAEPVARGSIFRLREIGAEKLRLSLAASVAAPLLVTLETEAGSFIEPGFHYESRRRIQGVAALEVPLEVRSSEDEAPSAPTGDGPGSTTVVVLERPSGLLPSRLRIGSSTPFFQRAVEIWDDGAGARGGVLGRGRVFRVEAAAAVEELEVGVGPASGDTLRVTIENGSSPALTDLAFVALLPRPALLFALPSAGGAAEGAATATLRFGGGRAFRPRYDVASLRPSLPAVGESAQVAEALYDASRLPAATLGAIVANPAYDPKPALAWAQRAGAALDPRLWSHRRGLEAKPSPEGLSRMRLGVADLGVARADLADLRILDGEQRQWAYLLERGAASETLALASEGPRSRDGESAWTLTPPAAPATADLLTLDIAVPYFDRPFELRSRLEGDEGQVIASGQLARAAGDPRPVLIAFAPTRFDRLDLIVTDGDDAPLEIARVEARFPVPEVFFAAPAGSYSVLLGQPEAAAPRYDLERARAVVLAVRSAPAEVGALEDNAAFSASARLASGSGWQRVVLWGAIAILVGFLTVLTLRLARRESE
jgi:hypothetical protein